MTWVHLMGISSIHDHMKGGYGHMIYLVFDGVIDDLVLLLYLRLLGLGKRMNTY